jgi:hypothetical protein
MRSVPALALLLLLPACQAGSSDDAADADTGTTEGTASSEGSADSAPEPSTGSTTATDPTTADDPSTDGPDPDAGSTDTEPPQSLPPTNGAELVPWLEAGEYLEWAAESGVHPSSGPHFGGVRTFVNDVLHASLEAGAASHPEGAAAVKELYGAGGTVLGWSVEVKVQADSAGGDGWYWYEGYQGDVYADGTGAGICTGCHGGGNDYVLSPFPLQ